MKAMEYQTICIICWVLGLTFIILALFTATYCRVYTSWWSGELRVDYPFQGLKGAFGGLAGLFLFGAVDAFLHMRKMLEKKEVYKK